MPIFETKTGVGFGATEAQAPISDAEAAAILRAIFDATQASYVDVAVASGQPKSVAAAHWRAAKSLLDRLLTPPA